MLYPRYWALFNDKYSTSYYQHYVCVCVCACECAINFLITLVIWYKLSVIHIIGFEMSVILMILSLLCNNCYIFRCILYTKFNNYYETKLAMNNEFCPIIVDTFCVWNLYKNVPTIMGHYSSWLPLSHNNWYICI